MEIYAITTLVISEEILRLLQIKDDQQAIMSNAEVITFSILAAKYFTSNYKMARYICKKLKLFPRILSNSRLNRRIHRIPLEVWKAIFRFLALIFKQTEKKQEFAVDSFPIAFCQKNRIDQRKLFLSRKYLGYAPSKKRYFCGIKIHMLVTSDGKPVEMHFRPGSESDIKLFWEMELDIPQDATIYADGAYNCFELEDILKDEGIRLLAKRGVRAKQRLRTQAEEEQLSS